MSVTYENPKLSRDVMNLAWSVRGDNGVPKRYLERDWDVKVTFTHKPLRVGDRVTTTSGLTGKIVAIHEESKLAWLSGINAAPVTLRLKDLRHVDDVQG